MPFQFRRMEVPDVVLVEPLVFEDERGFFMETFKASDFAQGGISGPFVQDNHAQSVHDVLRGLHYQKRAKAQGKLVRVVTGEVFDVAVDVRRGSGTFGRWVGVRLSAANRLMLYVPPGFAHGYCILSDVADVIYKTTAEYDPSLERGINWSDPDLAIAWPVAHPHLSARDAELPRLRDADNDF